VAELYSLLDGGEEPKSSERFDDVAVAGGATMLGSW